jgi:hypothetical protein
MIRILFFIFCFQVGHQTLVKAQEDSVVIAGLWEMISRDTFPYLRSHGATETVADASLMMLQLSKEQIQGGYPAQYLQAYYYNLLANRLEVADSLAEYARYNEPAIFRNMLGHVALRYYVPCYGISSAYCDSVRQAISPYLAAAASDSEVMPKEQWQWMLAMLRGRSRFPLSPLQLSPVADGLTALNSRSMEGGILRFSRAPGKENLLVSNGPRLPLLVLELDQAGQWQDVTTEAGLDTFPGGHLLYNIDFNADGLDDLMVLRMTSSRKSPAKYYPLLFRNRGDGSFEEIGARAGLQLSGRINCACWHDINEDGLPDVFLGVAFTRSYWLVQQADGSFENMAWSYGTNTGKDNIVDCAVLDINQDGLADLFLSNRSGSNSVFVQTTLQDTYKFFHNKAKDWELEEPLASAQLLPLDFQMDGLPEILVQTEFSNHYDIMAAIMNRLDTIDYEPSILAGRRGESTLLSLTEPDAGFYRAGIVLEQADRLDLLAGGGMYTESLYPMFHYRIDDNGHQSALLQPEQWPAYVHSAAVYADADDQPVLVFKGGGAYPFMMNRSVSYRLSMPEKGRFVRLFRYEEVAVGTTITLSYQAPGREPRQLSRTVRPLDSRGFFALQEWIWLPEGHQLSDITYEKKAVRASAPAVQEESTAPAKSRKRKQ